MFYFKHINNIYLPNYFLKYFFHKGYKKFKNLCKMTFLIRVALML